MLSRLPTSLAELKAGNNSEKLCTDQKHLQNNSIKVWSILFKHGNNFYEQ